MFDLSTLVERFHSAESTVEDDLHSKIGQVVISAAEALIGLLPDGTEVESILAKLDGLASEAHAVAAAVPEAPEPAPEAPPAPAEPEVAPTPPETAEATTEPPAAEPDPEQTAGQSRPV